MGEQVSSARAILARRLRAAIG